MSDVTSLRQLVELMRKHGAMRIYAKQLAQNDNSKNQVYLGGDFSSLNIIPHGDIFTDDARLREVNVIVQKQNSNYFGWTLTENILPLMPA